MTTWQGLVGPDGAPIPKGLSEHVAFPTMSGMRTVWRDGQAANLTPRRMAEILRAADMGDGIDYLTLAEDMEERETQYGTVLGIRKRAIQLLDVQIDAASDAAKDVEIADDVRGLFARPELLAAFGDMLDALGKGFSAVEMIWETTARRWTPAEFIWRDPRFFQFDRLTGRSLRLRCDGNFEGEPLAPAKFVVHVPRLKSGLPLRGGLARFAVWAFLFKSYSLRDWASFLETYGMPIRLGKYGLAASEDQQRLLLKAVRQIASDAAAIIPESMSIDFISDTSGGSGGSSGGSGFGGFAEYLDEAIAKVVLGQTLTTDKGANRAQAQVHDGVRKDVAASDARQLALTLTRDVMIPYITINYGAQARYPTLSLPMPDAANIQVVSEALDKLVRLGLDVEAAEARAMLGFRDPKPGAKLLTPPAPAAPGPSPFAPALNRAGGCACCGGGLALNRSGRPTPTTEIEAIGAHYAADWRPQMEPMLKPIFDAVAGATSLEQLRDELPALYDRMDTAPLERLLAAATAIARGLGDVG